MTRILSIATDVPQHTLSARNTELLLREQLARWNQPPEKFVRIHRNSCIETRHTVYGQDSAIEERALGQRNADYVATSIELAERVVRRALHEAQIMPQEIDAIISVSCTGFMLPSVDAYLINRLGMGLNTRRLPITQLGCSAGAVGLARGWEHLQVYPRSRVLLLSMELPSLTFQPNDRRPSQLISSLIFADGAAAAVLGATASRAAPTLLGSRSYMLPDTTAEMGYQLDESGFHIVLSAAVPELIKQTLHEQVRCLVTEHGFKMDEIRWCAMHPAGPKVLRFVEEGLNLTRQQLAASWQVLREYGNMSSASVLFVLAEMMRNPTARPGEIGLIIAFGPGISGEIVLARWED